jgi:hypothetical protein
MRDFIESLAGTLVLVGLIAALLYAGNFHF